MNAAVGDGPAEEVACGKIGNMLRKIHAEEIERSHVVPEWVSLEQTTVEYFWCFRVVSMSPSKSPCSSWNSKGAPRCEVYLASFLGLEAGPMDAQSRHGGPILEAT